MKELLLHLFQTSADTAGWYAPLKSALEGVTEAQARSKPDGNHSIAALTAHLHFYQQRELLKFQGKKPDPFEGSNDDTFAEPAEGKWDQLVKDCMATLSQWQKEILAADHDKLKESAGLIGEIAAHLAYHTGQIILLRKWQASWDPAKGVH